MIRLASLALFRSARDILHNRLPGAWAMRKAKGVAVLSHTRHTPLGDEGWCTVTYFFDNDLPACAAASRTLTRLYDFDRRGTP